MDKNNGKLGLFLKALPSVVMLIMLFVGFAGGYTVLKYQVRQNNALIKENRIIMREFEHGYVSEKILAIELGDLKARLERIENKLDKMNGRSERR